MEYRQNPGWRSVVGPMVSGAVEEATYEVQSLATVLAPQDKGNLRRNIKVRFSGSGAGRKGYVIADVPYAQAVELGSMPHPITPRNKTWLHWIQGPLGRGGREVFAKFVMHPGHPQPHPFLRPALHAVIRRKFKSS